MPAEILWRIGFMVADPETMEAAYRMIHEQKLSPGGMAISISPFPETPSIRVAFNCACLAASVWH
jgi:hypothetical protein